MNLSFAKNAHFSIGLQNWKWLLFHSFYAISKQIKLEIPDGSQMKVLFDSFKMRFHLIMLESNMINWHLKVRLFYWGVGKYQCAFITKPYTLSPSRRWVGRSGVAKKTLTGVEMSKPLAIQKCYWSTDRPTNRQVLESRVRDKKKSWGVPIGRSTYLTLHGLDWQNAAICFATKAKNCFHDASPTYVGH